MPNASPETCDEWQESRSRLTCGDVRAAMVKAARGNGLAGTTDEHRQGFVVELQRARQFLQETVGRLRAGKCRPALTSLTMALRKAAVAEQEALWADDHSAYTRAVRLSIRARGVRDALSARCIK